MGKLPPHNTHTRDVCECVVGGGGRGERGNFFFLLLFNYANYINKFNYSSLRFYWENRILTANYSSDSNDEVNLSPPIQSKLSNGDSGDDPEPEMEPPKDLGKKKKTKQD